MSYKKEIYKLRLKYGAYVLLATFIVCLVAAIYAMLDARYNFSKSLAFGFEKQIMGDHRLIFPSMTTTVFSSCVIFLALVIGWILSYQIYHKYRYKVEFYDQKAINDKYGSWDNDKKEKLVKKLTKKSKKLGEEFDEREFSFDGPKKKRISKKKFLIGAAIILGHNLVCFMIDQLNIAFEKALSEKIDSFFWVAYGAILLIVFFVNTIDLVQANAISGTLALKDVKEKIEIKKIENEENEIKKKKDWKLIAKKNLAKYGVFAGISFIVVVASVGWASLSKNFDWINFDLPPIMIGENQINWFTNQQNTFFLIFTPIFLFTIAYNFALEPIDKMFDVDKNRNKKREENISLITSDSISLESENENEKAKKKNCCDGQKAKEISFSILKTTALSLLSAVSIDISVSVANSMQELRVENGAYALCVLILLAVNVLTAYCAAKQYIDSPKRNFKKLEYVDSELFNEERRPSGPIYHGT